MPTETRARRSNFGLGTMVRLSAPAAGPLECDIDGAGPRSGGCKLTPPPPADWEWELRSQAVPVGKIPPEPAAAIVEHTGGCHCGAVRFAVDAPSKLVLWECNCTDCRMRRNLHFVVPKSSLRVSEGGGGEWGEAMLAE